MPATLTVTHADNELIAVLNCVTVYDKKTQGDPVLNDVVELTPFLKAGCCCNCLVLYGINLGGPANFAGTLTIGNAPTIPFSFTAATTLNGMIWQQVFVIP